MRTWPRWAALVTWTVSMLIAFGAVPLGLSALADRRGWDDGPNFINLLGLVPLAAGVTTIVWVLSTHWKAAPHGWSLERGVGPNVPPMYLLRTGPYARSRHPLFLGELLTITGWAIVLGSVPMTIMLLLFVVGIPFKAGMEERQLRRAFGAAYDAYEAEVPRWL